MNRYAGVAVLLFVALSVPQLASAQTRASVGTTIPPWTPVAAPSVAPEWQSWDPQFQMQNALLHAAPGGGRVLRTAQAMLDQSTIVRGSCYDWIRSVFEHAEGRWSDAFRGSIQRSRYAQVSDLQPGDWVLFVNQAFGGDPEHTHSAIFVGWADPSTRSAVMISYPGGRRDEPGRYGTYELTQAYRIVRMQDDVPAPRPRRRPRAH